MAKPRKSLKAKSPQKKVATNDQMKDGKTKKKKYDYKNFKMYIYRVLKQVHSDKGMSEGERTFFAYIYLSRYLKY